MAETATREQHLLADEPTVTASESTATDAESVAMEEVLRTPAVIFAANASNEDLEGFVPSAADQKLHKVYGDWLHRNPGTHLDGGVADDAFWQNAFVALAGGMQRRYELPPRAVGRAFLEQLVVEMKAVRERKSNGEKLLVFISVVLVKSPSVCKASEIKERITHRIEHWKAGNHQARGFEGR